MWQPSSQLAILARAPSRSKDRYHPAVDLALISDRPLTSSRVNTSAQFLEHRDACWCFKWTATTCADGLKLSALTSQTYSNGAGQVHCQGVGWFLPCETSAILGAIPGELPHGCRILDVCNELLIWESWSGEEMSFLNLWHEARANVLRRRYEDLRPRIDAADPAAKAACFGVVKSSFEFLSRRYASGSSAERKEVLRHASKTIHQLSDSGDWPRALGLTIIMFNLEARHLPGNNAAVLKEATDALLEEACAYPEPQPLKRVS